MATIVLQAAGAFIGGMLGPVGHALGSAAGAMAGYMIDRGLIDSTRRIEGPRLRAQRPFSAEEGTPIPRLYGTARIAGNLIWATRFEEAVRTTRQGGKAGPRVRTYHYFANAAFSLCEGEIAGVRRIWADGREIDRESVTIRIHRGGEDQLADPLLLAKQGAGNAPAYRGLAYAVVERLPLDDYGNRLPQFQFEVMRPVGPLNGMIRAVALIPGATEYGLSTQAVTLAPSPGETVALNRHVLAGPTDLVASLDELQALCPNLEEISLVVTWFGTDLRAGQCAIRPAVTAASLGNVSHEWRVGGLERHEAALVSSAGGAASYGGTPADFSVIEAIGEIRSRGLRVTLHPFIMMDVPVGNALPNPYGREAQPSYPWRGRITCDPAPGQEGSADGTAAARAQVAGFCGAAVPGDFAAAGDTIAFSGEGGDWGYRRFLLHHAHLAAAAGGVYAFLLGSELRGLTTLRDGEGAFPFVEALTTLADEVRGILGPETALTYGADWTEYFGHQPADGSGDVVFHLDPLWAHEEIAAVGINNYMPLSDWRDSDYAGGNPDGFGHPDDEAALARQIAGGERFDWYYASDQDRIARLRTPISDGTHGKPWVFRTKDLVGWWQNEHFDRPGGTEAATPTAWVPRSKPIWFTELGCPAADKGANQPNVFPDPKSSENAAPHFSSGGRSDAAQRAFLGAHLRHWDPAAPGFEEESNPFSELYGGRMLDIGRTALWAWDARPFPAFPSRRDVWADGANWQFGHWLNGRLCGAGVGDTIRAILADHGLPDADASAVSATLGGYIVEDPTTARAAIEPLAELFGLAAAEGADGLRFVQEAAGEAVVLERDALVVPGDGATLEWKRLPDHELPRRAELAYREPFRDYQAGLARAVRDEGRGGGTAALALPAVLDDGQAAAIVQDWLERSWAGRDTLSFAVSATATEIAPGAIVTFGTDGEAFIVARVAEGLARQVEARRLSRRPPAPWHPALPVAGARPMVFGRPHVVFLDLPLGPQGGAPEDQFRIAVRARPWRNHVAMTSPEATGFAERATIAAPAVVGRLLDPLFGGFEGRIDRAGAVRVRLFEGELASISRLQMLNGANAAAVRSSAGTWEVLQFEAAEEVDASIWQLTSLLRGQLGTGDAMAAGAPEGADFVLLDERVRPAGLDAHEAGIALSWRVAPAGSDLASAGVAASVETGGLRALTPLSPVHLRLRRDTDGDVLATWIRRGRIDADSWNGTDIPLCEEEEAYLVAFGLPDAAPLRVIGVSAPMIRYEAADIAADFGGVPEEIEASVRQISRAVGPGMPARRRLMLA